MTKLKKYLWAGLALVVALTGGGFYAFNKKAVGIPAFYVWKALSGKSHGGAIAEINGVKIYYETYGKGPPVLVLHGGTLCIEAMHYQISDLAKTHLVIAPDSRGHGRSTDGDGPLHYAQMADDMLALMDLLKIEKADIVGWSDGGNIALDLAMRHPDRVGRIAVSGANFDTSGFTPATNLNEDPEGPSLAGQRDFYKRLAPDPAHWPVFFRKVLVMWASEPHYTLEQLATIKAPTLVIAGEHDSTKREHTDALAKAIPGAQKVIIAGASHAAPLTHYYEVDAHIVEFLAVH